MKSGKSHLINKSFHKTYDKLFFFLNTFLALSPLQNAKKRNYLEEKSFLCKQLEINIWPDIFLYYFYGEKCALHFDICIKKILKNFKVHPYDLAHLTWPDQIKYMGLHEVLENDSCLYLHSIGSLFLATSLL